MWYLVLEDGSRFEIEADISFEIKGGQKFPKGTIPFDEVEALNAATSREEILLESSDGDQYPVALAVEHGGITVTGVSPRDRPVASRFHS